MHASLFINVPVFYIFFGFFFHARNYNFFLGSYVSFGKEGGSITATTKGDTTYVVGKKMTLNGKVKIVLGDGNTKTTLKFAEGKGGEIDFL